jgi:hypothetical protein
MAVQKANDEAAAREPPLRATPPLRGEGRGVSN